MEQSLAPLYELVRCAIFTEKTINKKEQKNAI